MIFKVKTSTGLARCKLCGELIKKGQKQLVAISYHNTGSVHRDTRSCRAAQGMVRGEY